MRYYQRGAEPEIERRGHAARIINTNKVVLTAYGSGNYWDRTYRRKPSDTLKDLPPKDQKMLLQGARTKRERKALAALT